MKRPLEGYVLNSGREGCNSIPNNWSLILLNVSSIVIPWVRCTLIDYQPCSRFCQKTVWNAAMFTWKKHETPKHSIYVYLHLPPILSFCRYTTHTLSAFLALCVTLDDTPTLFAPGSMIVARRAYGIDNFFKSWGKWLEGEARDPTDDVSTRNTSELLVLNKKKHLMLETRGNPVILKWKAY